MLKFFRANIIAFLVLFSLNAALAQYAPPAGITGSTAIYKDSTLIKSWANNCIVTRGPMDISHPENGAATAGVSDNATGKTDNNTISLGDGGSAIFKFNPPIINGPGFDFAVFENGFSDVFLELAFVEISSDSIHFYRFPSISLTDTTIQTGSFGTLDATKIHNLAGKYRGMYGTPFDLEELKDSMYLQLNNIRFIKIIDVTGSLNPLYASYDSQGHKINDPWPTPFESSGFDLDAIGIINQATNHVEENHFSLFSVFPNPSHNSITVNCSGKKTEITITDLSGKCLFQKNITDNETIDISMFPEGIYFIKAKNSNAFFVTKFCKNK